MSPGTRFGELEILHVIGIGGFGIVYLAYDHSLERNVALKEYMPSTLAARVSLTHVTVQSSRHVEAFQAGMRSFINEAKLLAHFDHPSLVKVYRFWQENDTAYMVMPFYKGPTLKQALQAMAAPPDETWLKSLLEPLLDALDMLHAEQCFHRDIAPDNILMLADGRPLLLDFGAARRAIAGVDQSFTVILKPGYAPIEQYDNAGTVPQGPWTDIYALASVVYLAITGDAPTPSTARVMADPQIPLARRVAGRYSDAFLQAIDQALMVRPEQRPQSIADLRSRLGLEHGAGPSRKEGTAALNSSAEVLPQESKPPGRRHLFGMPARFLALATVAIAAIATGSFVLLQHDEDGTRVVSDTRPELPSPLPGKELLRATSVLEQILQARSDTREVAVSLEKEKVVIGKDHLRISIRSATAGYVYLLMVGTGDADFRLLFPNRIDGNNRIEATRSLTLPRPNWRLDAYGPPGTNHFLAIVSDAPRDYDETGALLKDSFLEFQPEPAEAPPRYAGPASRYTGKVKCEAAQAAGCPDAYGAQLFHIQEVSE